MGVGAVGAAQGEAFVRKMEAVEVDKEKPVLPVVIAKCGLLSNEGPLALMHAAALCTGEAMLRIVATIVCPPRHAHEPS